MAGGDSLIGGNLNSAPLTDAAKNALDSLLNDTQENTIQKTEVGGATVIQGLGANNETQLALVGSVEEVQGVIDNGNFVVDVNLPANVSLTLEGLNQLVSETEAANYLNSLIDAAFLKPENEGSSTAEFRASLENAVKTVLSNSNTITTQDSIVRMMNVIDSTTNGSSPQDIKISGSATSTTNEIVAVNMSQVNAKNTVVLDNIDSILIVGNGSVRIDGDKGTVVVGDNNDQSITGGDGADTLVGGGGHDTLIGGGGSDTFSFNFAGQYTINDFDSNRDKLLLNIPDLKLSDYISDLTHENGNTKATFSDGSTITFVGVNLEDITASMFDFFGT